jgi:predicted AAA+ superfamily ATPase
LIDVDRNSVSDIVRYELAELHSREFSYQNIMQKTRLRKRDTINEVINQLMNHGYLARRRPLILAKNKTSYLSIYSYTDPGFVTYLSGEEADTSTLGFRLEGYFHSRMQYLMTNSVYKTELSYFKPYDLNSNGQLKYKSGEIDFVFKKGSTYIPIETKLAWQIDSLPAKTLEPLHLFMQKHQSPFGILIYGGLPKWDRKNKIIYWPYWWV